MIDFSSVWAIRVLPRTGMAPPLQGKPNYEHGGVDLTDNIVQEVKLRELNQGDERWKKIAELTAKSSREEQ